MYININIYTHTHTHIYTYIYVYFLKTSIFMRVQVEACSPFFLGFLTENYGNPIGPNVPPPPYSNP